MNKKASQSGLELNEVQMLTFDEFSFLVELS